MDPHITIEKNMGHTHGKQSTDSLRDIYVEFLGV